MDRRGVPLLPLPSAVHIGGDRLARCRHRARSVGPQQSAALGRRDRHLERLAGRDVLWPPATPRGAPHRGRAVMNRIVHRSLALASVLLAVFAASTRVAASPAADSSVTATL